MTEHTLEEIHVLRDHDLRTNFRADGNIVGSIDGAIFAFEPSNALAIVGEPSSAKSVTSLSIRGLIQSNGWSEL